MSVVRHRGIDPNRNGAPMTSARPPSTQHHAFTVPCVDGTVDLDQVSTDELTRLIAVFLGILADRRVGERQ